MTTVGEFLDFLGKHPDLHGKKVTGPIPLKNCEEGQKIFILDAPYSTDKEDDQNVDVFVIRYIGSNVCVLYSLDGTEELWAYVGAEVFIVD